MAIMFVLSVHDDDDDDDDKAYMHEWFCMNDLCMAIMFVLSVHDDDDDKAYMHLCMMMMMIRHTCMNGFV